MVVVGDASRASTCPQFAQFILASGCQCDIRPEIKQIISYGQWVQKFKV